MYCPQPPSPPSTVKITQHKHLESRSTTILTIPYYTEVNSHEGSYTCFCEGKQHLSFLFFYTSYIEEGQNALKRAASIVLVKLTSVAQTEPPKTHVPPSRQVCSRLGSKGSVTFVYRIKTVEHSATFMTASAQHSCPKKRLS